MKTVVIREIKKFQYALGTEIDGIFHIICLTTSENVTNHLRNDNKTYRGLEIREIIFTLID